MSYTSSYMFEIVGEASAQLTHDFREEHEEKIPIPSPDWHLDILSERGRLIDAGEETFSPFEDVKQRLNRRLVHA